MKTSVLLLIAAILLSLAAVAQGEEMKGAGQEASLRTTPVIKHQWYGFDLLDIGRITKEGKIGIELNNIVLSKHMWHGFDLLDDHGAFIPVGTITFGDSGFSGKIIDVYPLSSGFEKSVERNYAAFYTKSFFEDRRYATKVTANYFYYGKQKRSSKVDAQETGACFCWPKLFATGESSIIPSYYFGCIWASESHSEISGCEGFIHVFSLAHDLVVPDFWAKGQMQVFRLSGDITYNDGFGGVDHDWSHAVIGLSTNLQMGNLTMTPSVNYQISMNDSVNDENELWCGLNLTYRF